MVASFATVLLSVSLAAAGESRQSTALEQYRKLRFDSRSLSVQSTEPLRFSTTATCYKLPKSFVHEGWIQLVAVDTAAGTVRLADLGQDHDAARTLTGDGRGGWRWLARSRPRNDQSHELLAWALPADEMQPRLIGRVELPSGFGDYVSAYPGEQCTLIGGHPPGHALLKWTDAGISVQVVERVRGVRLWHPQHQAFAVQTDPNSLAIHELLDCDGQFRPLPEADAARFAAFPRQEVVISSRGDWLVRIDSHEGDEIVLLQGKHRRSFGPFEWMTEGCPDICAGVGLPLFDPHWSPSGETFMTRGLAETTVVNGADLKILTRWNLGYNSSGHWLLLSDSMAMELSKKRGAVFHRW